MKHVSILVPQGDIILSSAVGPFKIFSKVNEFLMQTRQYSSPFYEVELVGLGSTEHSLYGGAFSINAGKSIDDIDHTDLIIIPAVLGDIEKALEDNRPFYSWMLMQHAKGAEIASLCMGAFLLAATGLVNGKSCTTHWMGAEAFRRIFPQVDLLEQKVITDENGIYSSGGAYSFLNLILHLVEKFNGREVALFCAKVFEIDIDRVKDGQAQFAIFRGQKEHDDEPIINAQHYIEENFNEKISVEKLAERFALSRRNFIRRFKKATSNTPIEYIQRVKIEAAKKSLETTLDSVNEIMYDIGYNDGKAFRNIFRKYTGLTPAEYKSRYNRANRVQEVAY